MEGVQEQLCSCLQDNEKLIVIKVWVSDALLSRCPGNIFGHLFKEKEFSLLQFLLFTPVKGILV